ncbi:hypothetical protein H4P02_23255 [Pseudomonas lundensis]|nr:hypothetical protein [Pseudomonas lundensis]
MQVISFFALWRKISVLIVDTSRVKVVSGGVNAYLRKSKMPFLFEELDSRENADLSSYFVEDSGRPVSFKRLVLPGESGPDLFKYIRIAIH